MTLTMGIGAALVALLLLTASIAWWRMRGQNDSQLADAQLAYRDGRWVAALSHLNAVLDRTTAQPLGRESAVATLEALTVFDRMVLELGFDRPEWLGTLRHRLERAANTGKPVDTGLLERLTVFLGKTDSLNQEMLSQSGGEDSDDEVNIVQLNLERVFGHPRVFVHVEQGEFPAHEIDLNPEKLRRARHA